MSELKDLIVLAASSDLGQSAGELVEDFLKNVYKEPSEALGGLFADKINLRRFKNLAHAIFEAKRLLRELGLTEKEVPLKVIHPLLEAASLEEDSDMRKRWANLLANAADPREQRPVVSSFVAALNDLSSRDARFLDALFANETELKKTHGTVVYAEQHLWKLYARAGLASYPDLAELLEREDAGFSAEIGNDASAIQFMIEILQKHLIIEKQREQIPVNADGVPVRVAVSHQKTIVTLVSEDRYKVTEIGRRFLVACGPPVR